MISHFDVFLLQFNFVFSTLCCKCVEQCVWIALDFRHSQDSCACNFFGFVSILVFKNSQFPCIVVPKFFWWFNSLFRASWFCFHVSVEGMLEAIFQLVDQMGKSCSGSYVFKIDLCCFCGFLYSFHAFLSYIDYVGIDLFFHLWLHGMRFQLSVFGKMLWQEPIQVVRRLFMF